MRDLMTEFVKVRKILLLIQIKKINMRFQILLMRFIPRFYVNRKEFNFILDCLRPIDNGHPLIRVGGSADGGYLIPDDLIGITHCFSAGVANSWSFEQELLIRHKIRSTMYDGSITKPMNLEKDLVFHNLFVGTSTGENFISMFDILNVHLKDYPSDLIAQIDIEGSEYSILHSMSEKDFNRFRIIVIEFHRVDEWIKKSYYTDVIQPIFEQILKTHTLVHAHENNFSGNFKFRDHQIPMVVELTFHNNRRAKITGGYRCIPHPLDADNWQSI